MLSIMNSSLAVTERYYIASVALSGIVVLATLTMVVLKWYGN